MRLTYIGIELGRTPRPALTSTISCSSRTTRGVSPPSSGRCCTSISTQIAGSAANAAGDKPIATQNVHARARDYFLRDKMGKTSRNASDLLDRIINQCVEDHTRALPLLRSGDSDNPLVQELYDLRLIHRVRQAVSLDEGSYATKYDIYLVDFGCFVDLIPSGRIRTVNDGLSQSARLVTDANVRLKTQWMVNVKWSPWSGGMRGE